MVINNGKRVLSLIEGNICWLSNAGTAYASVQPEKERSKDGHGVWRG